jgi:phosphoglycerate kinase
MIDKVDEMIIGGGMAFTFLKRIHNINIGNSLFDAEGFKNVDDILAAAKVEYILTLLLQAKGVKIHLPLDFVCGTKLDASSEVKLFDLAS